MNRYRIYFKDTNTCSMKESVTSLVSVTTLNMKEFSKQISRDGGFMIEERHNKFVPYHQIVLFEDCANSY